MGNRAVRMLNALALAAALLYVAQAKGAKAKKLKRGSYGVNYIR